MSTRLSKVALPVLMLLGADDEMTPAKLCRRTRGGRSVPARGPVTGLREIEGGTRLVKIIAAETRSNGAVRVRE